MPPVAFVRSSDEAFEKKKKIQEPKKLYYTEISSTRVHIRKSNKGVNKSNRYIGPSDRQAANPPLIHWPPSQLFD